jgi:outer membrane protein assembly factor BamB
MKMFLGVVLVFPMFSLSAAEAPWPQFRGSNSSGVAEGQKPPVEFGPNKNLLWKAALPAGASSPVIAGDRIFTTGFDGKKLWTIGVSRKDGKEVWRAEAPAKKIEEYFAAEGSPAASTPATDGERVVAYFGSCGLVCYDLDGKELWRAEMPVAETNNRFGSGTSPILHQGRVYLARDLAQDSALFCFDAKTGKELWKTPREGFPTAYSTPIFCAHDGTEDLVVGGALRLKGYDPATGAERWLVRNMPAVSCGTPVVADGLIYSGGWAPGGEDAPMPDFSVMLKSDANGDGKLNKAECANTMLRDFFDPNDTNKDGFITKDEWDKTLNFLRSGQNGIYGIKAGATGDATDSHIAWKATRGLPYVPSPLYYHGRVYFLKDGVFATCVDAKSGNAVYTQTRLGVDGSIYASPVAADGRIYGVSLRGTAFVYSAGDKPELLSKADLGERASGTPAIADNVIYVRSNTALWAFGKK